MCIKLLSTFLFTDPVYHKIDRAAETNRPLYHLHLQSGQWTYSISWVLSRTHSHISVHCACVAVIHSPYRRNFLHFLHLCSTFFTAPLLFRISRLIVQAERYAALLFALKTGPTLLCWAGPVRHDTVSHPPRFHTLPLMRPRLSALVMCCPRGRYGPVRQDTIYTQPFLSLLCMPCTLRE